MLERRTFIKFFSLLPFTPFLPKQPPVPEEPRQILLAELFIAEFQYHEGVKPEVFQKLRAGDGLILQREPDNPHDPLAMAVFTKEENKLGYVPRACNQVPALIADQDVRLTARIAEIQPDAATWERVLVSLWEEI